MRCGSRTYLGYLVAGHLVASRLVAGHLVALTAVATCLLGACGEQAAQAPRKRPAAKVRTVTPKAPPLQLQTQLYAEVRTRQRTLVGAEVAGRVLRVLKREGESVKAGETLALLDARVATQSVAQLRAELRAAEAEATVAQSQFARLERAGERLASRTEVDEAGARASRASAEAKALSARLASAEVSLTQHRLRAPFSGEVLSRLVDAGSWVAAGDAVVELTTAQRPELWAYATPALAARIRPETPAHAELAGQRYGLTLLERVAAVTQGGSTQLLRFALPADAPPPTLGLSLPVTVEEQREGPGWVVPRDALTRSPIGEWQLYRVRDGKAQRLTLRLKASSDTEALVTGAPLSAGDAIVVRGNERLTPDAAVTVLNDDPTQAKAAKP